MARPTFTLTDDQARTIAARVNALQMAFPYDQRSHRPFVRGFMLAVQEVTGQLYSPAIYHRLLAAFAPERKPSTATLAAEKQRLATAAHSGTGINTNVFTLSDGDTAAHAGIHSGQLHLIVSDAVQAALLHGGGPAAFSAVQVDFYASRLKESEHLLSAMKTKAMELAAQLASAKQECAKMAEEIGAGRDAWEAQAAVADKLVSEVAEMRIFALVAIDEARGESRVWKERCIALEGLRRMDAKLLESFRRHAYRAGSPIPEELR